MSIKNIAGIKQTLDGHNVQEWTKNAEIHELPQMDIGAIPFKKSEKPGETFGEILAGSLKNVNDLQKEANRAVQKLVSGESKNIHETMLTVEKAEIAFKTMNRLRMKVIEAYQEVMKMQI